MFTVTRRLISLYPRTLVSLILQNNCEITSKTLTFVKNFRFQHNQRVQFAQVPGSRYAPGSPLENAEDFILSKLKDKSSMTEEEWEQFKFDLMDCRDVISEENFSSVVMNTLLTTNQLDLSHNFLKYLENSHVKPNFLTYLKYVSLCSRNRTAVGQEHILRILDKVIPQIDSSPVLDLRRAEYVIQGLCATDRWRDSFKYLDKLVNTRPNNEICNALAGAAIRNEDEKLAWEILLNWMTNYEFGSDKVIEEFLLAALKMQKKSYVEADRFVEKLFAYMQKHDIIISLHVAKLVEQYFLNHRLKWDITYAKVTRQGVCKNCCHNLELFELKDNEYNDIREAFLQRVVKKSDLYINTNKREFENYLKFVNTFKPFHIVVDGLNAAYSCSGTPSRKKLSIQLFNVIKAMSGKTRKLLVMGRDHMRHWPDIRRVFGKAKLFFTDNISQDDPYVVLAALLSGPHTLFLSGDLMRDHISRLEEPKLIHLFKRWQLSHQMFIESESNNNFRFIEPVRHSITLQGSLEKGLHIPYDDKIILDTYEELNNWLCIKKVIT